MRVTSVSLFANEEEAIRFDLRNVSSQSPYVIRSMIGLDAEELIPRFDGFSKDGSQSFYDVRMKPRDIVMRIVLNPRFNLNETHDYIRDTLYKAISATRSGLLEMQFQAGASIAARIFGHMTKFEVAYFSKTPELQITIKCDDPLFRGMNPVVMQVADLPTVNPIVVADSLSTAPHGLSLRIAFKATTATFTIRDKNTNPEWEFKVTPASSFLSGDVLYLGTEFNNRYLYMVRSGVTTHLLDRIDPSSIRPTIFPGFNQFWFPEIASFNWQELRFDAAFWGV